MGQRSEFGIAVCLSCVEEKKNQKKNDLDLRPCSEMVDVYVRVSVGMVDKARRRGRSGMSTGSRDVQVVDDSNGNWWR